MKSPEANSSRPFFSRRFWAIAAALWTTAVVALAVSPNLQTSWLMKNLGDKVLHGAAFTVGAIVWIKTFEASRVWRLPLAMTVGALAALAVGVAIEIIQSYVPHRRADFRDFMADVIGVLAAMLIIGLIHWLKPQNRLSNA